MRMISFHIAFLVLFLALLTATTAGAGMLLDERGALDVLVSQIRKDRLYDSWTSLSCLFFMTEAKTKGYFDFAVHEKHGGACPGDPVTAPVVDRFRVNRLTRRIQWIEPGEGRLLSYGAVLKFRLAR
jgi:hypothetical protein